jgi:hypothetical protein
MAGRYVILEFEDRDAAQSFVMNEHLTEQLGYGVVAMYIKPKVFCTCPDKKRVHQGNWRKHKKYGLFICTTCNKPSTFHNRGILERLQYAFGYSILGKS